MTFIDFADSLWGLHRSIKSNKLYIKCYRLLSFALDCLLPCNTAYCLTEHTPSTARARVAFSICKLNSAACGGAKGGAATASNCCEICALECGCRRGDTCAALTTQVASAGACRMPHASCLGSLLLLETKQNARALSAENFIDTCVCSECHRARGAL